MRALLFSIVVSGCAPAAVHAPERTAVLLSDESREERELGREIHERIGARFGFYGDRRVCAYVERVGRRVTSAAARRELDYAFFVVDDGGVNAFAVPGGYVYVTRGLLSRLGSEAELAAVLAHEIAHIDRKHALRQQAFEDARSLAWSRADTLRFYEKKRDNEREADWLAARMLKSVGYDPWALSGLLERLLVVERELEASEPATDEAGYVDTHPATLARIARVAHALARQPKRPDRREVAAHRAAIDGITIGDNPQRGYLHGRRWVLPSARVSFEVPPGWSHRGSGQGLWATSPRGSMLFLLRAPSILRDSASGELERREVAGHAADWYVVDVGPDQAARALVVDVGDQTLWLIAAGQAASKSELDQLPAAFSVAEPALLERRPERLMLRAR